MVNKRFTLLNENVENKKSPICENNNLLNYSTVCNLLNELYEENELLKSNETIDLLPTRKTIQAGEEVIIPGGMKCQFVGTYDTPSSLPTSGENGDVCLVRTYDGAVKIRDNYGNEIEYPQRTNVMFMYRYGQWKLTNLFTEPEEFMEDGEYVPRYLIFGANIIKMDKITISTNIGECTLTASILPRYI